MSSSSKNDNPPRPEVPPGLGGPVRNPNNNDVLSGRGGRINSHPGNVRFREMVDSLKREYLDPRTKKIEKARIAARLVTAIRRSDPPGRFLKEDPHTGLWIEIGDERAWKKAGQALRESAPEIRAEQQAQLQAAAERAGGVIAGLGPSPISMGRMSSKSPPEESYAPVGGGEVRAFRQASDPPGPRHRPNPPEREGLARRELQQQQQQQQQQQLYEYEKQVFQQQSQYKQACDPFTDGNYDDELELMRQQYQLQQRIQAQYAKRSQMQGQGQGQGNYRGNNDFDDFNFQQAQYRQQQRQQPQQRFSREQIAAALMSEDLLPVDAGFVIPSLGTQQYSSNQQQSFQQCYPVNEDRYIPNPDEVFNGRQYNPVFSSDKTVSTMSSFDVQSMDMSSLGGFSFTNHSLANQSQSQNLNVSAMSGLISTGSALSRSGTSMARKKQSKSSLERKLEKVNEAHRRQQMEEMEKRRMQAMLAQGGDQAAFYTEVPTKKPSSNGAATKNNKGGMMSSLTSFGFEDIAEEDNFEEASIKMSNLGLSEMEMTFSSDVFSVRSKVDQMRERSTDAKDTKPEAVKRTSPSGSDEHRRSPIAGVVPSNNGNNGITASSVFGSSIASEMTASNRDSMSSTASMKKTSEFDLDHFNESLRSMDLEDRGSMPPDPPSNVGEGTNAIERSQPLSNTSPAPRRRQREPTGGSLPSLAAGGKSVERGGAAVERAPGPVDLGLSDPNVTAEDFGISFNSIRSFASQDSDASSWLDQYQSMENVAGGMNPWDEEGSHG
eukprot:CCRYP_003469-RA/>CCRYP_003469-RA protein AED:0.30 eAED:0.30 QI:462/1/1/1/0/0.5/2/451/775